MALSGSFSGYTNNQYITPTIEWSAVQSIDGNYSDVTATLKYSRTNTGYTTSGTWSGGIVVNSSTTVGSKHLEITYNSGTVAISTTVRVYHNADGTRITTIGAYGGIPGTSFSTTDISSTITLDTIPRATTPVAVNMTLGMPAPITLNPASSAFRHTIVCNFGNESVLIADKTASTSINWTPPLSLAEQIPKSTYGVATIVCTTYNGNVSIGTKSVSINLTIPNSMVPTISSVSVSENVSGLNEKFGAFVQSKSKLAIAVSASGIYGSTIASCQTGFEGVSYSGLSVITNTISGSGEISLTVNVTDTRGMSATTTTTVNVLEYSSPTISRLSAYRVTPEGVEDDDGERIALRISYKKASVGGKNGGTLSVSYREESESAFLQISSESAQNAFDDVILYTTEPVISVDNAYVIRVTLQDFFSTINADTRVESSFSLVDFNVSGTGLAIGMASLESNLLDVNLPVKLRKPVSGNLELEGNLTINGKTLLDFFYPVGSIYYSTSNTNPSTLFGGIWERIKDVFLLAAGDQYAAGSTGGEASHTLTSAEMPNHKHDNIHISSKGQTLYGVTNDATIGYRPNFATINYNTGNYDADSTAFETTTTGGNGAHNNMPPYKAVYIWTRTG